MKHWMKDAGEYGEYVDKNLFGDCEKTLKKLCEGRIFDICRKGDNGEFSIFEMCDEYFGTKLTVDMCEDLSVLFAKIASVLKENNSTK